MMERIHGSVERLRKVSFAMCLLEMLKERGSIQVSVGISPDDVDVSRVSGSPHQFHDKGRALDPISVAHFLFEWSPPGEMNLVEVRVGDTGFFCHLDRRVQYGEMRIDEGIEHDLL